MKSLFFIGTRPEAIKVIPVYLEFKSKFPYSTFLCNTGQHGYMLNQVLDFFSVESDFDLKVMTDNQNLTSLNSKIISLVQDVVNSVNPDFVFVHGDTATAFSCSFASFLNRIKICHIESGLRTSNKYSPFPEEMNRRLIGQLADFHFCPTPLSKLNLVNENIVEGNCFVVGNSAMDALELVMSKIESCKSPKTDLVGNVLVTIHRSENRDQSLIRICEELIKIASLDGIKKIIFPVHLNPNVKNIVFDKLEGIKKIQLLEPLSYKEFVTELLNSDIIITDSGGIQEEVTYLGIPTLVVREFTERPEAVEYGPCVLVSAIEDCIFNEVDKLVSSTDYFDQRSRRSLIFGDGKTGRKIFDIVYGFHQEN